MGSQNDRALAWLVHGGDTSTLGTVDGRIDLRGVDARSLHLRLRRRKLTGLDLRESHLVDVMFAGCQLRDCLFDGADLTLSGGWQSVFDSCSFRGARMTDWVFSGDAVFRRKDTVYRACDFSGADLRRVGSVNAVIDDCLFDNTKLDRAEFRHSRLTKCVFKGPLSGVTFADRLRVNDKGDPDALRDVDFSEATFTDDTGFMSLNLEGVQFPKAAGHTILSPWEPTLRCAIAQLGSSPDTRVAQACATLGLYADLAGPRQQRGVVVHSSLFPNGDADLASIIDVLNGCEAICSKGGNTCLGSTPEPEPGR